MTEGNIWHRQLSVWSADADARFAERSISCQLESSISLHATRRGRGLEGHTGRGVSGVDGYQARHFGNVTECNQLAVSLHQVYVHVHRS